MDKQPSQIELARYATDAMRVYGQYTIDERVVPDVRDGLKTVQRRILWVLHQMKATPDQSYRKARDVEGQTAAYHPHGDASIGKALIKMAKSADAPGCDTRYPLVDGYGNWGSYDEPPAAARYIDCRLTPLATRVFDLLEVTPMVPDYKGDRDEPLAFASRVPLLLINGSRGIAVGLNTAMPPHNLNEIIDALCAMVKNPDLGWDDLFGYLSGPDHEWGGFILDSPESVGQVYRDGQGTIRYTCNYHFEESGDHHALVITGFGPDWLGDGGKNLKKLLVHCGELVNDGQLISAYDDTSLEQGVRIVIEFGDSRVIEQQVLPKMTSWVSYQWYTTVRHEDYSELKDTNLLEAMQNWLDHQREYEAQLLQLRISQTATRLARAEARLWANQNLDLVTNLLKTSKNPRKALVTKYKLTDDQASTIMEMPVRNLAKLNRSTLQDNIKEHNQAIRGYQHSLDHLDDHMIQVLEDLRQYGDERRTVGPGVELPGLPKGSRSVSILSGREWPQRINLHSDREPPKGILNWAVSAGDGVVLVTATGHTNQFDLRQISARIKNSDWADLPDVKFVNPVGSHLALIDSTSKGVVISVDPTKPMKKVQSFKTSETVYQVVTLRDGDSLVAYQESSGHYHKYGPDEVADMVRKRNSMGKNLLPGRRSGVSLLALGPEDWLLDDSGESVPLDTWVIEPGGYQLGKVNLWKSGNRAQIVDQETCQKLIVTAAGESQVFKLE